MVAWEGPPRKLGRLKWQHDGRTSRDLRAHLNGACSDERFVTDARDHNKRPTALWCHIIGSGMIAGASSRGRGAPPSRVLATCQQSRSSDPRRVFWARNLFKVCCCSDNQTGMVCAFFTETVQCELAGTIAVQSDHFYLMIKVRHDQSTLSGSVSKCADKQCKDGDHKACTQRVSTDAKNMLCIEKTQKHPGPDKTCDASVHGESECLAKRECSSQCEVDCDVICERSHHTSGYVTLWSRTSSRKPRTQIISVA